MFFKLSSNIVGKLSPNIAIYRLDAGVIDVFASIERLALHLRYFLAIFLLSNWSVNDIYFGHVPKRFSNNHI